MICIKEGSQRITTIHKKFISDILWKNIQQILLRLSINKTKIEFKKLKFLKHLSF